MLTLDRVALAKKIDHTLLTANATSQNIVTLCDEAKQHGFFSVCVNPTRVALAVQQLKGSSVLVCTVIGFPLGANATVIKLDETSKALRDGAKEIDVVMNVGRFLDGDYKFVADELAEVRKVVGKHGILKVIVETALLDDRQKEEATRLVMKSGAEFIKTSTGTIPGGGAKTADLQLFRRVAGETLQIKASGEIRDLPTALAMLEAGADRIGASRSVAIVTALPAP